MDSVSDVETSFFPIDSSSNLVSNTSVLTCSLSQNALFTNQNTTWDGFYGVTELPRLLLSLVCATLLHLNKA